MTKPVLTDELAAYFELRDKVAVLLKEAGVKKRARHFVAEVLIDAGVIDFAELDDAVVIDHDTLPPGDAPKARTEALLEEMLDAHTVIPGFGAVIAYDLKEGQVPEVLVRSADFDVPDRWVSLAEVQGH